MIRFLSYTLLGIIFSGIIVFTQTNNNPKGGYDTSSDKLGLTQTGQLVR